MAITVTSLPSGVLGVPYSQVLAASGGMTPYIWMVSSGNLPFGLTLASNGTIRGTPTASAQSSSFTVKVTDSRSPAQSASQPLSITITSGSSTVSITTTSLPSGVAGTSYSSALSASGGKPPYSWVVVSGNLPNGLTLASNGTISGTPTQSGTFPITVQVKDSSSPAQTASQGFSIVIAAAGTPVSITTSSLPNGTQNVGYSTTLAATGGKTPYTWTITSGSFPAGLTLAASSGTIGVTPTASAQSSSFTVKVTDSSSPAQSASKPLSITIASGVTATPGATATQYVMSYTAANSSQCMIEVSTSPTYNPLVHAVDPTIFANANFDGQTNAGSRAFAVGQKWIAQENVAPPVISVGSANRGAHSNLVTVNYNNQPFAVGDNITITGMSNSAYNDSWARVDVATANSFNYEVLTAASAGGDTSGSGIITRANRYSLALAADTTYYYRIGGASNTCGASPATGTFSTMNIPNGNTWEEGPVTDNNGLQIEPTIPESRTASFVDPLTGANIHRVSLFSDANVKASGWTSGFFRPCSITTSSNGFYHCQVGLGDSAGAGIYSIKSTGETHWLGFMHFTYTDSGGHTCCQQGVGSVISAFNSTIDTTNANVSYGMALTNAGFPYSAGHPAKSVLVKVTYPGNDAVDAATGAYFDNSNPANTTALTPDPSNTLTDKFVAFDAAYDPQKFPGCAIIEAYGDYLTGNCASINQGSPTWLFAYQISTSSVVGLGPFYKNPRCRWCGSHGTVVDASDKWIGFSTAYMIGPQTGEWHANLASPISSGATSLSVTAPVWQPSATYSNFGYPYDRGFAIVDSNGNLQVATTYGTTGSGAHPTWNTSLAGTTSDGTVVWTNEGAATSVNEPQNIFPRPGGDGTTYWSFLMPVAGATGGGGEYNGDLFKFDDGTNECVRVVTVGSSGQWTSVTRGYNANGISGCAATASAHSAGASLRALCEQDSEAQAYAGNYWDFIDDPHMTDTTDTKFVQQTRSIGHGYVRQAAPHGNIFNTFQVINTNNPFLASDFTGNISFELATTLKFSNITTDSVGVTHQDYTNWDSENASFKDSALGALFFVTGGGSGGYGSFSKVGGTTSIYKYSPGSALNGTYGTFSSTLPYVPTSGGNTIKDISGLSSALTDGSATPTSCIVVAAGECWSGSVVDEMYANLPVVDAGSANICNNGGENASFLGHDWCMMNTSTYGNALNQYGLLPANFLGNDPHGVPIYGAGLSRRIAQNALGGFRLQSFAPHAVPDGTEALFMSCIADAHLTTNGAGIDPYGCQVFAALIPPQPTADGIDRTNYENVTITIGAGSGGATQARVKYGYQENEPNRGTTWPPAIHFYCTQYQGTCYSSNQNLSLGSQQTLQIGVPQRVLFYQVEYLNGANQVVASDPIMTVAIP